MKRNAIDTLIKPDDGQLLDAPSLLKNIFPPECRPTLRWLRDQQKRRRIPYVKIGRFVFFDPSKVRQALNNQRTASFGGAQ